MTAPDVDEVKAWIDQMEAEGRTWGVDALGLTFGGNQPIDPARRT